MIDKESIILKYEQQKTADLERDTDQLVTSNTDQEKRLAALKEKMNSLYQKTGKAPLAAVKIDLSESMNKTLAEAEPDDFDSLFALAANDLNARGLSIDDFDYNGLISENDLNIIIKELNAPLPREVKWRKSDFIVTFAAALVGCIADIVLGNRNNKLTGQDSAFSKKLNTLHEKTFAHEPNAPIDYQGKGFGGGYHRELSKGHDILRFVEGINQFKTGTFEGVAYQNGVKQVVKVAANQYENPYPQLSLIDAITRYAHHMFADLFSTYSLPFPGYSFLRASSDRDIRKFAVDMYHNGFNCKNVITQSLSTIIIEVIVRIYFSIQSVREYKDKVDVKEDYSNFEALKVFINPQNKEKLNEMLLVAHAIVMAENIGKIVIKCVVVKDFSSIAEINVTEIMAVVRYGVSVVKKVYERNNEFAKLIYHADIVNKGWNSVDETYYLEEKNVIEEAEGVFVF